MCVKKFRKVISWAYIQLADFFIIYVYVVADKFYNQLQLS
jgi:hypothetical protein